MQMLNVDSPSYDLISAAVNTARAWAYWNEKPLLSLEGRLKPCLGSGNQNLVDVYVPLDIMVDADNYALMSVYAAAIDSAFRVYQNNPGSELPNSTMSVPQNPSRQEAALRTIRGLVPTWITDQYHKLRNLTKSIEFFLNDSQRQVELYLKHDAWISHQDRGSLERLQIQAQRLYAIISQHQGLPFDKPINPGRLRAIQPSKYKN